MRDGQKRDAARSLRRRETDVERALWRSLRDRRLAGLKFRRQVPIGPYVADFACVDRNLVIELDGGQHAESPSDAKRDVRLRESGWRVLRIWNNEVTENLPGVLQRIAETAGASFDT